MRTSAYSHHGCSGTFNAAVLVAVLTATVAAAAFDDAGWQWRMAVMPPDGHAGFVRLTLPVEVFARSQASLADLRVIDGSGEAVPHVVHWGRKREMRESVWQPARLINRSCRPGSESRVTLDFETSVRKNRVRVHLGDRGYRRRVLVEGADSPGDWAVVTEDAWLIDVTHRDRVFRVDTLELADNDFRYLRITVYNERGDERRVEIRGAGAALALVAAPAELVEVPVAGVTFLEDDERKVSVFEIDLRTINLPLARMELQVNDDFYQRGYVVAGRNTKIETVRHETENGWNLQEHETPWRTVASGVMFRTRRRDGEVEDGNTIGLAKAPYRFLKLEIYDRDDAPLRIAGIKVLRRDASLVFERAPGQSYAVIGGNPEAAAPDYDLAAAVTGVDEQELPAAAHGEIAELRHEPQRVPWTERSRTAIWAVLIIAVAAMGWMLLSNLHKLQTQSEQQ